MASFTQDNANNAPDGTANAAEDNFQSDGLGAFINGRWYCDCEPRELAKLFQAKGPKVLPENRGRWFYKCPKNRDSKDRCDCFIWVDEARKREQGLSNVRPTTPTGPSHESGPAQTATPSSRKRSRADEEESANWTAGSGPANDESPATEYGFQAADEQEFERRARHVEFSTPRHTEQPRSPRATQSATQPGLRADYAGLSSTQGRFASQLPTPDTGGLRGAGLAGSARSAPAGPRRDLYSEMQDPPSPTPIRHGNVSGAGNLAPAAELARSPPSWVPSSSAPAMNNGQHQATPSKKRILNALDTHNTDILTIFDDHIKPINSEIRDRLQNSLETLRQHIVGVELGRDATRTALHNKDQEIQNLTTKVHSLESETASNQAQIQKLIEEVDRLKQSSAPTSRTQQRENGAPAETARRYHRVNFTNSS